MIGRSFLPKAGAQLQVFLQQDGAGERKPPVVVSDFTRSLRINRVKLTLLLCNLGRYGHSSEWKRNHHQASCQAGSFRAGMLPTLSHLLLPWPWTAPLPHRLALQRVDALHSLSPPLLRTVHFPPGFASGPAGGVGRGGLVMGKLPSSRQLSTQREATRGQTHGEAEDWPRSSVKAGPRAVAAAHRGWTVGGAQKQPRSNVTFY